MKTKWTLLLVAGLGAIAAVAGLAQSSNLQPMSVGGLTGDLRIQQTLPCVANVDQTTPVTGGRIEISPADGIDVPGGKQFMLTRANVSFEAFSISRTCAGVISRTRNYTEIGVQLGRAVSFTGVQSAPGIYNATIPADSVFFHQAAVVNGDSETGSRYPKEPVTATIDLNAGTVQMRIVVDTKIHIKAGCVDVPGLGEECVIDGDYDGALTATLSGTIAFADSDGDGVADRNDSCRFTPNANQSPVATPILTPPPALTINSCLNHLIGAASAIDVCDATPVTITNNAAAVFNLGLNVVAWTGVDGKGRIGNGTQNVTVVDTTKPIFTLVPPPIALNDCKAAQLGLPKATDDCAGTPTLKNNAPWKFPVGPTVVTWTAKDVSGNQSTATQTVTVTDAVAPTLRCEASRKPRDKDWDRGWYWDRKDWDWDRDHDRDDHDFDNDNFRVSATDACTASPSLRLGSFNLRNGEIIEIELVKKSGIKLVHGSDRNHVRRFQVGPGQNVITSTDSSGNVATARCVAPPDHDRDHGNDHDRDRDRDYDKDHDGRR